MKYRPVILISFLTALLIWSGVVTSNGYNLSQFLGPHIGKKYLYDLSDGGKLEVTGISSPANDSIEIEERIKIPGLELPDGIQLPVTRYKLDIIDDQFIKKNDRGKVILLQSPIKPSSAKWEVTADTYIDGKSIKVTSICQIAETKYQVVLGKERFTVTVQCQMKSKSITTIIFNKYAIGIGLFERSLESTTEEGESYGIQKTTLTTITESGM